ncbi:probable cationic amino acid transporter [Antennarius striatus]|uniref:probable cationic amino acid transporter n=1 Tax=Antennarius striatus TaxID=241820 RepID=UPI0035AEE316
MGAWLGHMSLSDTWYHTCSRLLRTKPVGAMATDPGDVAEEGVGSGAGLARVLTTVDLVSLGVGSCVGTGMYVVAGLVAKATAGPGVILSFVIAAVASVLSGVCYAELGVRVPRTTGSAYTYSYVTVGELAAFVIGWNLILEYVIGTAAGAAALSSMFDSLANHSISAFMTSHLGTLRGLGKGEDTPPDLLALAIALGVTLVVALGVRNSLSVNNFLNGVNLLAWGFTVAAALFFLSASNWEGGNFLPYGWSGVMKGAATCFYAFIGFDIIATTGEEARSPDTAIPYAISASLATCLTAYLSVSVVLTLLVPYRLIDGSAPLMQMFAAHGFLWGKYVVALGSVAGLTASLLGSLFPMPRVIYAMARDGLLFRFLSHVSARTHTPVAACVLSGGVAALLALLLSLADLIEMMSIGTLLAYTLVSVCVLLLRYQPPPLGDGPAPQEGDGLVHQEGLGPNSEGGAELSYHAGGAAGAAEESDFHTGHTSLLQRLLGSHYHTLRRRLALPDASAPPTAATGRLVTHCTLLFFVLAFVLWAAVIFGMEQGGGTGAGLSGLVAALVAAAMAKLLMVILQQPQSGRRLPYMAPGVPFVPVAAILVNSYLMLKLSALTWIRFAVWGAIGLLIYGCYGVRNSSLELELRLQQAHASSYQRYDDAFLPPDQDDMPYQGWAAPEEGGYQHQNQRQEDHGYQSGPVSSSRGRTNQGFDEDEA